MLADEFNRLLHDSFSPVTVDELNLLEDRLDLQLPPEYREFLLRQNGGYFHDRVVREDSPDNSISYFLACRPPFSYCDIEWNYKNTSEKWIPGYLLPVADTKLNDIICIGIEGDDAGTIYLCSRVVDILIDLGFDGNPEKIAPSFRDFIDQCTVSYDEFEVPVEDCPLEVRRLFEDIYHNNISGVDLALRKGIDTNARATDGTTPLAYAAANCRFEIIDLLLARGADLRARDNRGLSVIGRTVYSQCSDCIKLLVNRGADLNSTEPSGESPLDIAIQYKYSRTAGTLILLGADSKRRIDQGQSLGEYIDSVYVGEIQAENRNWLHEQVQICGGLR